MVPMLVVAFGIHGINRRDIQLAAFLAVVFMALAIEGDMHLVRRRLRAGWQRWRSARQKAYRS